MATPPNLKEAEIDWVVFYVDSDVNDKLVEQIRDLVDAVQESRPWLIRPPTFVDETEEPDRPDIDFPVRTVGVLHEIYSGRRPPGKELPYDIERALLSEIETLMERIADFSRKRQLNFGVTYRGAEIGSIVHGTPDASLSEGLLGEWRRTLESRKSG